MVAEGSWTVVGLWVRAWLAFVGLLATALVAFGAFPLAVWVGWRVASGGWGWVEPGQTVNVLRMLVGTAVGFVLFVFGRELRVRLVEAWREGLEMKRSGEFDG